MRIIARKLILLAKQLISGKSKYIYDPEHKKKPGGGYKDIRVTPTTIPTVKETGNGSACPTIKSVSAK